MINSDQVKLTHNEEIKLVNPTLAGGIGPALANDELDRFEADDEQFLKFHGIYQQDDRDKRKTGKQYIFMIRGRIPGGLVSPDLYLTFDRLATDYANTTLRITSRQSIQFHGVVKRGLAPLMKGINDALSTTLAACGDVCRNVMAPPTPATNGVAKRVLEDAARLSKALLPETKAYHEIWVEGVRVKLDESAEFEDPLYGKTYLPRKFKIGFAIPPLNDTDIFTQCLGLIAIQENETLLGYNLLAGGGMGMSHNNPATFPRMADVVGFLSPERLEDVARGVLTIHRDFGDRANRKHARLKYVLADRGVDWFREELENRVGFKLSPARSFDFTHQGDRFGWFQQVDGRLFLGLHVLAGRIKDDGNYRLKSALKAVVEAYRVPVRLTPSQNALLVDIPQSDREAITGILAEHGVTVDNQATALRRASMACVALPTCGLALAESERYFPDLMSLMESLLADLSLEPDDIVVRMTGCPNGCVRPYLAELGFVGRAPNKYHIFLGGNQASTRMARLFKEGVKTAEMETELRALLTRYRDERQPAERFGDFAERVIWPELPVAV